MFKKLIPLAVGSLLVLALGWPAARPTLAAPAGAALSFTYTVNSFLDGVDVTPGDGLCRAASGACTLRAAIMEADQSSLDAVISVPAGVYTLTIAPDVTDGANTGDLNLTTPASGDPLIILAGAGAGSTIIDAHQIDGVLTVDPNRSAIVLGVTLRGGLDTNDVGAGIRNDGVLIVYRSIIRDNQDTSPIGQGGGIHNANLLTLQNSTVSGNSALGGGGLSNSGLLTITNSTVSGNSANYGGGLSQSNAGQIEMTNSTVSSNSSTKDGGGFLNFGAANLYNTTVVFNWADSDHVGAGIAGGVLNDSIGLFNVRNTLLAGNRVGDPRVPVADECAGTLNSYGQNFVGVAGDLPSCTINIADTGNWGSLNGLDQLGPLQDNGGPTLTHALLADSNTIDTGDPTLGCIGPDGNPLETDQRGLPRVVGVACDVGALEFLPPMAYLPVVGR